MTNEDKKKIYAALAAPFPENAIQRTEGRVTGRGYDTAGIGYQFICNRLNEVLGLGGWRAHRTVNVKEITTAKGRPAFEAICDLTLELGSWQDGDFVVFAESLSDGGHTSTSEADARKGAYTNALKKAAAMFGCGRQAYEGTLDDDNVPSEGKREAVSVSTIATQSPPRPSPLQNPAVQAVASVQRGVASPRNRLSSKQLSAIWAIGRKLGYEQAQLRAFIKQTYGAQPEFLTRDQASQVISGMSARTGNGHADAQLEPGSEG
jgi:hypothetical protein